MRKDTLITMKAGPLAKRLGKKLVGKTVLTTAMGDWPGGWAVITEIEPDAAAPEIVFQVEHPNHGKIGVFDYETIIMTED